MDSGRSINDIKGIGPKKRKALNSMGIFSVEDLLYYFPRAYEDRRKARGINSLKDGEKCFVRVFIESIENKKISSKLKMQNLTVRDEGASAQVVFFNKEHMLKPFSSGDEVLIYGKFIPKRKKSEIIGAEIYRASDADKNIRFGHIVPVYSASESIKSTEICRAVKAAIDMSQDYLKNDYIPESVIDEENLCPLEFAIRNIHFPSDRKSVKEAMYRMIFEEFFIMSCRLKYSLTGIKGEGAVALERHEKLNEIIESLPFKLTGAQSMAVDEIISDMSNTKGMRRLLQGDVGCGKTAIAAICMANCALGGYQSLIMAPTEVLAQQHYKSISGLLDKHGIRTAILTGSTKKSERLIIYEKMKSAEIDILVGTHALINDELKIHSAAFVVTDEQQRFGVNQRRLLLKKGTRPHVLHMSATPIPRTLAITMYSDMAITTVDELPFGRKEIVTRIVTKAKRKDVYKSLVGRVAGGAQAYVVCPLVEESESMDAGAAQRIYEELLSDWGERVRIGLLHGRMTPAEKETAIDDFKASKTQVLVCTTVVEVGMDVPNASIIVIEDAERFGLSQLHQLRGRVGRGDEQSYCILMCSCSENDSVERLKVVRDCASGFEIAQRDLEMRGPGEFSGQRQHGMFDFRLADIVKHEAILKKAQRQADRIFETYSESKLSESELLIKIVKENRNTDIC